MTGNGKHTTYFHGDDWGMVYYYCFTHISTRLTINIKKKQTLSVISTMISARIIWLVSNLMWKKHHLY